MYKLDVSPKQVLQKTQRRNGLSIFWSTRPGSKVEDLGQATCCGNHSYFKFPLTFGTALGQSPQSIRVFRRKKVISHLTMFFIVISTSIRQSSWIIIHHHRSSWIHIRWIHRFQRFDQIQPKYFKRLPTWLGNRRIRHGRPWRHRWIVNEIIPILLPTRRKIMEEPEHPFAVSGPDEQDMGESETGPGQSNAPVGSKGRRASAAQHFDDLQSLKIETMRGMAKTVKYSRVESICTCKVAYFTTKQLLNISAEKMPKLRQALDIQEPKLVIRLFPCLRGRSYWNRFPKRNPSNPTYSPPELSDADEDRVEQELNLIAKEVLLPLAVRSHALVVGVSACALMNAFANVCGPIQRRYGDKCPFRMICLEHACHLHMAVDSYDGVEKAIYDETPEWSRMDRNIRKALGAMFGADKGQWPRQQLLPGCEQYVIYESLDENDCRIDFRAGNRFSDTFLQLEGVGSFSPCRYKTYCFLWGSITWYLFKGHDNKKRRHLL